VRGPRHHRAATWAHQAARLDTLLNARQNAGDTDTRLYKKAPGAASALCFMGHTLMETATGRSCSRRISPTPMVMVSARWGLVRGNQLETDRAAA